MNQCEGCGFTDLRLIECPKCGSGMYLSDLNPPVEEDTLFHRLDRLSGERVSALVTHTIFDHIVNDTGLPLNRVILFYGGPGLGKSFHARQLVQRVGCGAYYSYEERLEIVKQKFDELGDFDMKRVYLTTAPFCADSLATLGLKPCVVVIDSLHMAEVGEIDLPHYAGIKIRERDDIGAAGSPRRLVALTIEAVKLAREQPATTVVLIGHETKDDKAAGPRTIEHLVDVVMKLEEVNQDHLGLLSYKQIVIEKNRCGLRGQWLV